jgi:2-succinyl-6-hydroxy-2,4-cyclohexadiene-1-carboxylate synthase
MMTETIDRCRNKAEPISQTLTLPCDTQLNVIQWGERREGKPACMLLHGLDNNARIWGALADRLCQYFTVYAIDFRGHGDSAWTDVSSYNPPRLLDDIEQVRQCLGLHQFYLVGHSLGGRVATHYTVRYPEYIRALVLGDVGPEVDGAVLEKLRKDCVTSPASFNCRESYYHYLKRVYALADEQALQQFALHSIKSDGTRFYNKTDPKCRKAILNPNAPNKNQPHSYRRIWELLPQIQQSTLIVRGACSAVLSESTARRMLNRLPNGQLATIESAGHAIMIDNPSQTIKSIEQFLLQHARIN